MLASQCEGETTRFLVQVTLTLPTKVDLLNTAALQRPPERKVHWRFFYAKGQRHAVEAVQGNRCALCQMMCLSFTVCAACPNQLLTLDLPVVQNVFFTVAMRRLSRHDRA